MKEVWMVSDAWGTTWICDNISSALKCAASSFENVTDIEILHELYNELVDSLTDDSFKVEDTVWAKKEKVYTINDF